VIREANTGTKRDVGLRLFPRSVNNFFHKQTYFHFSLTQSQIRFTGFYVELLESICFPPEHLEYFLPLFHSSTIYQLALPFGLQQRTDGSNTGDEVTSPSELYYRVCYAYRERIPTRHQTPTPRPFKATLADPSLFQPFRPSSGQPLLHSSGLPYFLHHHSSFPSSLS